MGKIYYMMGKSSSGKDTLLRELRRALPELRAMTLYTTRPPRDGERNGVEYFFCIGGYIECLRETGQDH